MKRFFAILVAALMLVCSSALAAEEPVELFVTEAGTKVTLTMQSPYNLELEAIDAEHMLATISREGVEDVIVVVSKTDSDFPFSLADMSEAEKAQQEEYLRNVEYAGYASVDISIKTTAAGNEYFDIFAKHDALEVHSRFTVFEGYYFDRMQFVTNGTLNEADDAFMEEVQQGMWVE